MKLSIVFTPSVYNNSAPAHIGYIISLLHQYGVAADYIHYTEVPFFLYQRLLFEVLQAHGPQLFPQGLTFTEERDLLERCVVEKAFGITKTSEAFNIDDGTIQELYTVAEKLTDALVTSVNVASCDRLLVVPPTPSLGFTFLFLKSLRERDNDIPVIVSDYYNFDPITPYFTAFLTDKNFRGENIQSLLQMDPLYPVLKEKIPSYVDCIITGEGYDVLEALFGPEQRKAVPGTTFHWEGTSGPCRKTTSLYGGIHRVPHAVTVIHSNPVELDSLPLPDYSRMRKFHHIGQMELSRGCMNTCIFCERGAFAHNVYRTYSVEYALKLFDHLQQYQFQEIEFSDSALNLDEELTVSFLRGLQEKTSKVEYQVHLRGQPTSPELIRLLGETGCVKCSIGAESGSQTVLHDMHKNICVKDVNQLLTLLGENNITAMLHFIVGFPTEKIEDVHKTASFIENAASICNIDLMPAFYSIGPVQKLSVQSFEEYGIQYAQPCAKTIESSSFISSLPGMYAALKYKRGMNRDQLKKALNIYADVHKALVHSTET